MMPKEHDDFRAVSHCGGKYTVTVSATPDGSRSFSIDVTHDRAGPATMVQLAANLYGQPIAMIPIGGRPDQATESSLPSSYIPVLLGSDRQGAFGNECPRCKGYWRSDGIACSWATTCPYCRLQASAHYFRTSGQQAFIHECCAQIIYAVEYGSIDDHVIDMDAISDQVAEGHEPPSFFYSEKSQQHRFKCTLCNEINDILGTYGYCSNCAHRNNYAVITEEASRIMRRIEDETLDPDEAVKSLVSCLDAAGKDYVKQLIQQVPMVPKRRKMAERLRFHDFTDTNKTLNHVFGIEILKNISEPDRNFLTLMFQRRHIFEHNAGVADEKYIRLSGDHDVKLNQKVRELRQNVERFAEFVLDIARDVDTGFHSILSETQKALPRKARKK